MKLCAVCGTPHPDDVTTSHHPDGCTCGLSLCGGSAPEGCIWSRTFKLTEAEDRPARLRAQLEQSRLIIERSEALRSKGPTQ